MQSRTVVQWSSFIGGAVVIAFFAIIILLPNETAVGSVQSASAILRNQTDFGLPVRLTIPRIAVDTTVEYVGITPDGAMDVPKGPDTVAWFNLGTRPGEVGSAVIAGHSGWKNNIPAIFDDLHKLRVGDKISVTDEKGTTTIFVVRKIRTYDPNANATDVFGSNDGKAHLNLITCEGTWDPISRSSSKRLVVFADKE